MKDNITTAVVLGIASLVATALAANATSAVANPAHHPITINVTASDWAFNPAKIDVQVGQPVTLHLTSAYGVHGIANADLGIPETTISPGKPIDVTFTATKPGTYRLTCTVFCGAPHSKMRLEVDATDSN